VGLGAVQHRIGVRLVTIALSACAVASFACRSRVITHAEDDGAGDGALPPPFFDCRLPPEDTSADVQFQISCANLLEVDLEGACGVCLCSPDCSADADCGDAPGGTATPACHAPYCVLECDGGKTCPEGMVCADGAEAGFGAVCVWPYDDPLQCYVELDEGEDPCAAYNTEAECNAVVSSTLPHRCDWITRRWFSDGAASCEVLQEESLCVATESAEFSPVHCAPEAACGVGDRAVYWRDLGGGTTQIVETSDCTYRTTLSDLSPCDFSGPVPIPLVCGCGCTGDEPASTPAGACECPSYESGP
jgi:hypothetical protein